MSEPQILHVPEQRTAVVRGTVRMDQIRGFYDRAFPAVIESVRAQGIAPSSAFGLYASPPSDTFDLEVGFVVNAEVERDGEVVPSTLPGGEVARLTHTGPYETLGESWGVLTRWLQEQGRTPAGPMWEVYLTEPTPGADASAMRTDLFCPLA